MFLIVIIKRGNGPELVFKRSTTGAIYRISLRTVQHPPLAAAFYFLYPFVAAL